MKASLLLLLIVAATSIVSAYPATPALTTSSALYPFSKRPYSSTNNNSTTNPHIENSYGWCIDVNPTTTEVTIANGALPFLNEKCDANSTFQKWSMKPYGNTGQYSLQILNNNITYCVDVPLAQLDNSGAWLQVWECAYTTNQLWRQNLLTSTDTQGNPGFQLVNVGSNLCLDQSAYDGTTHVAQWGCYPTSPSDIIAQTFHQLNCPLSGCNVTGINPTFVPKGSSSTSTSISTTSSSTSSSSASSSPASSNNGDNVTVNSGLIGGAIGGVMVMGIVVGAGIFFCLKKLQKGKVKNANDRAYVNDNIGANTSLFTGAGTYTPPSRFRSQTDLSNFQSDDGQNPIPPTYRDSQLATDSYVLTPIHFNKPEELDSAVETENTRQSNLPSPW